jgi:hypothetical protein
MRFPTALTRRSWIALPLPLPLLAHACGGENLDPSPSWGSPAHGPVPANPRAAAGWKAYEAGKMDVARAQSSLGILAWWAGELDAVQAWAPADSGAA